MAWGVHCHKYYCKGAKECCIFSVMEKSDDVTLWNDNEKFGNSGSEYEEDGIPECELDTTDIDGSGRERHSLVKADGNMCALCIKYIKLIAKYFFSADALLMGDI
jgi:hypothetical protein